MKVYEIKRNGTVKARMPLTRHADGSFWNAQGIPLVDSECAEFKTMGKEKIAQLMKAGKIGELPESIIVKGDNPATGLTVIDIAEAETAAREKAMAERTPAQVERDKVDALFAEAECAEKDSYYDPERIIKARMAAEEALRAWRAEYPAEAKEEKRAYLIAKAEREEEIAAGALTYDCDGSFSAEYRQQRHDEIMAKARALRDQAANL